jgi:hypothetical protein
MFPSTHSDDRPLGTRRAREIFMGVAKRAGLAGRHVKPHTTRHTACWTLSALGNKLEMIADFAGHRSTAVTNDVYIAMDAAQKRSRMDIPWLETDGLTGEARLKEIALELAGAIAGPFGSADGRTFPNYRTRRRVTIVEPATALDEERHLEVTTASVARAEKKAEKKAKKAEKKAKKEAQKKELLACFEENRKLLEKLQHRST